MKTYLYYNNLIIEKTTCRPAFFQRPKNPRFPDRTRTRPTNPIRQPTDGPGPGPETMRLAELDLEEKALLQDRFTIGKNIRDPKDWC